ncbi:pathogen-responsive alpha-dioxygenase family protein, putative [Babesia ovis]|uniref:Pathogen-responsive alpha-dioxygenase family protein, putative n=1 Tax=Babesia ovis TaxID=5869 RepID=A0A9W5T7Q3_BABOV|nr:pathogen-responsive alpha-dioxygenase family protein, putative [Babesia ovis]
MGASGTATLCRKCIYNISASKRFDCNKDVLVKNVDLAICRVRLLRKRMENDLALTYQAINSNGEDVQIKAEQSIYQENSLHVYDHLTKELNLLKTRKITDVPELRIIVGALRQMYGKDIKPLPDAELLNKLNPRPPSAAEIKQQIDKVNQLVRSSINSRPAVEKTSQTSNKRTELDDLLDRIHRLRS